MNWPQKLFVSNSLTSKTGKPRSPVSGLRSSLLSLVIYILLTLILTYPLIFNLGTAVPNDIGDPLLNTWILAWDSHALLADPLNLFHANIFYPLPNTLAYSEHLFSTALLVLPIQLISAEPIIAYNLSLLATFPLAAFGMYLLILHWTRQRSAAFVAGLIFAFAPYRFAAIAHLQLLTFQWLPFALLYLDKVLNTRQRTLSQPPTAECEASPWDRRPLILALFLILQLLASWYLALYTLIIIGVYLLVRLVTKPLDKTVITLRTWLLLISTILIFFVLIFPFVWPYLSLLDDLRAARPLSVALSLAAAPTDFFAAASFNRLFGPLTDTFRARPGFTEENTLFSGFVAPLLALVSNITIVLRVASSLWPSLPQTTLRNTPHAAQGTPATRHTHHSLLPTPYSLLPTPYFLLLLFLLSLTFPAPYALLSTLFPPSTIVRVPPRWIIPALFVSAFLAAYGYIIVMHYASRFTFHVSRFIFLLTCTLLLLETFSAPLPLAPVDHRATLNPAYSWLAAQPGDIALIELPLHSAPAPEYPEVKRLYASTLGWWKLVNGYSGYTPPRQPELARSLADFPGPKSITALQNLASVHASPNDPPASNLPTFQPSNLPSVATFQPSNPPTLQPPFFLLVHPGQVPLDRDQWENTDRWQTERHPALRPLGEFEGDYLYQVLPLDPARFTNPPLATFGPDQSIQLLAYDLSLSNFQLPTSNLQPPTFIPHPSSLILYWRSTASLPTGYTVFIHLRAPDGFVRSQADGPPVGGHYPTSAWQPGEVIQDVHSWLDIDMSQVDHLAVGLYNPATGERLPAFGSDGRRLADDAFIIPRSRFQ